MCFCQAWQHMCLYHLSTCAEGSLGSHSKIFSQNIFLKLLRSWHLEVRGQLQELVLPSTMWVLQIKLRLLGLVAGAFLYLKHNNSPK